MAHLSERIQVAHLPIRSELDETIETLLAWGRGELETLEAGESQTEAEWMLADAIHCGRAQLYLRANQRVPEQTAQRYRACINNRKQGVPLAYILGKAYFWNEDLKVGPGCLIPRPETEILIECFIEHGPYSKESSFSFLDLAAGSGAIAIALLRNFRNATATLSDSSIEALDFARQNVNHYALENRATIIRSDLFKSLSDQAWDLIVSNPPYLSAADWKCIQPELLKEPKLALDGGVDGLDFYRSIAQQAAAFLNPDGWLLLEIGHTQAHSVIRLCEAGQFKNIQCFKDHAGCDRAVIAQKS